MTTRAMIKYVRKKWVCNLCFMGVPLLHWDGGVSYVEMFRVSAARFDSLMNGEYQKKMGGQGVLQAGVFGG